jgi:hypothetical protein
MELVLVALLVRLAQIQGQAQQQHQAAAIHRSRT